MTPNLLLRSSSSEELSVEFPQYKFPDDLTKFYEDYPDRKNSITIHTKDLKKNLENYHYLQNNNNLQDMKSYIEVELQIVY